MCECVWLFEAIHAYFPLGFFFTLQVVGFLPHMGVFISLAGSWPTAKAFKLHTISFIILLLLPHASSLPLCSASSPSSCASCCFDSALRYGALPLPPCGAIFGSAAFTTRLFRAFTHISVSMCMCVTGTAGRGRCRVCVCSVQL